MSSAITLDDYGLRVQRDLLNSRIIALFLESAFWGIFITTYSLGVTALLSVNQPRSLARRNWILLATNTLMFVLATAHLALTIYLTLFGFVTQGSTPESTYDAFFDSSLFGSSVGMAQYFIYVTETLIGDGFMLYRLNVVWNGRRAVLAVPVILFIVDAIGGYAIHVGGLIFMIIFFSFSFFTNMLCSILILIRVFRSSYQIQTHWQWHSRAWFNIVRYRRVLEAIVQSAAIYSTASIALVVTIFISPNIGFPTCMTVFSQLIGIVFSLIIIHIARKSQQEGRTAVPTTQMTSDFHVEVGATGEKRHQSLLGTVVD